MNVAGEFRYVANSTRSLEAFAEFASPPAAAAAAAAAAGRRPPPHYGRFAALRHGGVYARKLARYR